MLKYICVVAAGAVIGGLIGSCTAHAHDWYANQKSEQSKRYGLKTTGSEWTCCNGTDDHGDCKPVSAKLRADGVWIFSYNDKEYTATPEMTLPDEANQDPLSAHACVHGDASEGKDVPLCFWKRAAGG